MFRINLITYVIRKVGHLRYFNNENALASLDDKGYQIFGYTYDTDSIKIQFSKIKTKLMPISRKILFEYSVDLAARLLGDFSLLVLAK